MTNPQPPPVVEEYQAALDEDSKALKSVFFSILCLEGVSQTEKNARISRALLDALHKRGTFFFHADYRDHDTAMYFDNHRKLLLWIKSDEFKSWLGAFTGFNTSTKLFQYVFADIQVETLAGKTSGIIPCQYWESRGETIYISSGRGHMVKVTKEGPEPCDNGTDGVLFASGFTLNPWTLTNPIDPFETCSLWKDAAYSNEYGRDLFKLWVISMFTNQRCKPPLVMSGPIGSGKSRTVYGLFDLFGIPARIGAVLETGEDNFWTSMNHGGLFCLDNADTRTKWLPDALAASATDGSHEKRRLYKDNDVIIQRSRSWLAITSANPTFASDAGLADRLIVVRLNARESGSTAESSLSDEVLKVRDAALTFIALTLQKALGDTASAPSINRRHPDFSTFAVKIGRALGIEQRAIIALRAAEADKSVFNLQNDAVGSAIIDRMFQDELGLESKLTGTAKEILDELAKTDELMRESWTPKRLSKSIARIWPHLQSYLGATTEKAYGGVTKYTFCKPKVD
jgi:hypothetical protein